MSVWSNFLSTLPPLVQQQLQTPTEPRAERDEAIDSLLNKLPAETRDSIVADASAVIEPAHSSCRWLLCVCPEGDFPRLNAFAELSGMLAAISRLDTTEVSVWAIHGAALRITKPVTKKSGQVVRYLLLPNQLAAEVRPAGEDMRIIRQCDLPADVKIEEEGWLGPDSLLRTGDYFINGYDAADTVSQPPSEADPDDNAEGVAEA